LQKGKGKWAGASTDDDDEAVRSLRAMMDIDDGMFFLSTSYPPFHFPPLFYFLMAGIWNIIFTLLSKYFTDQVIRVPHNPPSTTNPSTASGSPPLEDIEEDVEMVAADEDLKIKPPPRKRKPKKIIPVGRNGLKKRRVEKSRTSFDEKGYMGFLWLCSF
jgi:DNA polymerase delta subunit 3